MMHFILLMKLTLTYYCVVTLNVNVNEQKSHHHLYHRYGPTMSLIYLRLSLNFDDVHLKCVHVLMHAIPWVMHSVCWLLPFDLLLCLKTSNKFHITIYSNFKISKSNFPNNYDGKNYPTKKITNPQTIGTHTYSLQSIHQFQFYQSHLKMLSHFSHCDVFH